MTDVDKGMAEMSISNGHSDNINDSILKEFKEKIDDVRHPKHQDYQLTKWLKARNFDVAKAEEMYRNSMEYRKKMDLDTIVTDYTPPEVIQKYMAGGFAGFDKEGSPIRIELLGHLDFKGMIYSARKADIEKCKLQLGEEVTLMLDEQYKKLGKRVDGMTVITDMSNVGASMLWGPGMALYAHMGKILQDNYPECVKRSFIINAPRIFPMLWQMIRPLITEEMKRKVYIIGADYKTELLNHIEADQLPAFLGGTMTDPNGNPRCPSKICQGGKVPERYYLKELTSLDHLTTITVLQRYKYRLKFTVKERDSILRWEFRTDDYDIGFSIKYESPLKPNKKEVVLKAERINSHTLSEDGQIKCEKPGDYYLIFDNTYSYLRAKTVHYHIDVLPPEDSTIVKDIDTVTAGGSWQVVSQTEA